MNRDNAISIGESLNKSEGNRMVYLSGSASPPFCPRYLSTKMEAEEHLRGLENIKTVSLRPGFIYSGSERWWSVPLRFYCDANHVLMKGVLGVVTNNYINGFLTNFKTDTSVKLEDVVDTAIYCALQDGGQEWDGKWLWNSDIEKVADILRKEI